MGVALSILFFLWFSSGIVMMYWSFPSVTERDRWERAPVLDPSRIKVSPQDAYAALQLDQPPGQVRLSSFDGRPVYRFGGGRGRGGARGAMVYADDGRVQNAFSDSMADRAASSWARFPLRDATGAKKESVEEVDQWTVGGQLRTLRPLYKYSFADGQQVYVNGRNAEVVQYTTRESRFWAYLGAIPHWLYFTPLRKHPAEWTSFVVWTSGIGTVSALLGVVIAIWMLSPSKSYRNAGAPTSIPYRGWKRWHTIIGLGFGMVATTWAFSGLLSMGPFDSVERLAGNQPASAGNAKGAAASRERGNRDRGGGLTIDSILRANSRFELSAYAAKSPGDALASLGLDFQAKELEFTMFAGEPQYLATDSDGRTRIVPVNGDPKDDYGSERIVDMIRAAGVTVAEVRVIDQYDAYYLDRHREKPLPVIYVRANDESSTRYYIDPKTGRVAGTYSSRNWINRWLYHGLHSFDLPWLYNHRPLWDIVVILLMLGGTALCVTSLVLTWRVLMRKLSARLVAPGPLQPGEDLV